MCTNDAGDLRARTSQLSERIDERTTTKITDAEPLLEISVHREQSRSGIVALLPWISFVVFVVSFIGTAVVMEARSQSWNGQGPSPLLWRLVNTVALIVLIVWPFTRRGRKALVYALYWLQRVDPSMWTWRHRLERDWETIIDRAGVMPRRAQTFDGVEGVPGMLGFVLRRVKRLLRRFSADPDIPAVKQVISAPFGAVITAGSRWASPWRISTGALRQSLTLSASRH